MVTTSYALLTLGLIIC